MLDAQSLTFIWAFSGGIGEGNRNVTTKFVAATKEVQGVKVVFYEMRIQPYLTVDKKVDGAVLSLVDITDRKKLENEQKRHAEGLEQKVK